MDFKDFAKRLTELKREFERFFHRQAAGGMVLLAGVIG